MRKTALITGASSGIGYELSQIFAKNDHDLILVSRNKPQLEIIAKQMQEQYHVEVKVIEKDLSQASAAQELYNEITTEGLEVDVLVNNAGTGANGKFTELLSATHEDMIQLNITSLTMLCKLFATDMVKKGYGGILNVASTAAFQAGPFMSTYYASKAYVLLFSEALNSELKNSGVTVTTLCPGPTRTSFFDQAGMSNSFLRRSPQSMSAVDVARAGFNGLKKRKTIVVPGFLNKLFIFSVRLAPRSVTTSIARYLNQK